ncbi:MAG: RNA polymerase sigma factor [Deltaproteobacteria bacterium]|nr:RNA polymerase sigma factor [Deltaproteobacteria bacterium]
MADDFELLTAWRGGDAGAGEALFARHFDALFRFFRNKVGDDEAADLVQTTFLACVERRDVFRAESSVRTFLFAVARRRLYSHFESKHRAGVQFDAGSTSVVDLGATPSQLVERKRSYTVLLAALRMIPLDMQTLLELHYWEKFSGPQLAGVFDVAEGTVRTRLRRAKQLLAHAVDKLRQGPRLATCEENLDQWADEVRREFAESSQRPR